jgi:hypothetical protein
METTLYVPPRAARVLRDPIAELPPFIPNSSESGEKTFFQARGICVTKTRFIVFNQTFAMANITSVRTMTVPPERLGPGLVCIVGILICIGGIARLFSFSWSLMAACVVGLLIIAASIFWMLKQKPTYRIVLSTAGGDTKACQDEDGAFIMRMMEALNNAIISRG